MHYSVFYKICIFLSNMPWKVQNMTSVFRISHPGSTLILSTDSKML